MSVQELSEFQALLSLALFALSLLKVCPPWSSHHILPHPTTAASSFFQMIHLGALSKLPPISIAYHFPALTLP